MLSAFELVKHLLPLLFFWYPPLGRTWLKFLPVFFLLCVLFFSHRFIEVLYIFWNQVLCLKYVLLLISTPLDCLFLYLLVIPFSQQKLLILIQSTLQFSLLWLLLLVYCLRKLCLGPRSWKYSRMFTCWNINTLFYNYLQVCIVWCSCQHFFFFYID